MADLTIRVPPEHVDLLTGELLRRYADLAARLHEAARGGPGARDALLGARIELLDLDDALDQLGWGGAPPAAVELTAHPELLADAVTAALAAAAQRVAAEREAPGGTDAAAELRALESLFALAGVVLGVA